MNEERGVSEADKNGSLQHLEAIIDRLLEAYNQQQNRIVDLEQQLLQFEEENHSLARHSKELEQHISGLAEENRGLRDRKGAVQERIRMLLARLESSNTIAEHEAGGVNSNSAGVSQDDTGGSPSDDSPSDEGRSVRPFHFDGAERISSPEKNRITPETGRKE